MKRSLVLAVALAASLPIAAHAHKMWIMPSQTVIAGEKPWITVDAAVSNDLFYFNHVPLRLDNLVITQPDGTPGTARNPSTGHYRSVFDVELVQQGTYKLAIVNSGMLASWEENGQPKRWRGNAATFATGVPKNAQKLTVSETASRVESWVTNGSPTQDALKTTGKGLEMVPVTHPNDLFSGESAQFRLLLDGKPAAGLEIEVTRGATRYRNAQEEQTLKSGGDGTFTVAFGEPGMYWLETTTTDANTSLKEAKQRRATYVATLEVLPQ